MNEIDGVVDWASTSESNKRWYRDLARAALAASPPRGIDPRALLDLAEKMEAAAENTSLDGPGAFAYAAGRLRVILAARPSGIDPEMGR
jgi:hypothetical protein